MIRTTTLGGLDVHVHGRGATPLLGGPRHRALLVYLAVEREAPRALLATLLWPRQAGGRARRELSRTLHELTRVLGEHWRRWSSAMKRTRPRRARGEVIEQIPRRGM